MLQQIPEAADLKFLSQHFRPVRAYTLQVFDRAV
jgi:hypothetical protein